MGPVVVCVALTQFVEREREREREKGREGERKRERETWQRKSYGYTETADQNCETRARAEM